jgi:hypothetical protein
LKLASTNIHLSDRLRNQYTVSANDVSPEPREFSPGGAGSPGHSYEQGYGTTDPSRISHPESQRNTTHFESSVAPSSPPSASESKFKVTKSSRRTQAEQLPHLAILTAVNWRDVKKYNDQFINRWRQKDLPELPGEYLFDRVGRRDHVRISPPHHLLEI